jgi:glucose-1-phosphate thymidylyltransferase
MVISPGKSDLVAYYGAGVRGVPVCYVVQPEPLGLCDAVFRALPLIGLEERVIIGLPDTIWFPEDGLTRLRDTGLSFLLFPVAHPERFDAVVLADDGRVLEVQVKREGATTPWVWGALTLRGAELAELRRLHVERDRQDAYLGTLVNAYLERGGVAWGVRAGESYVDVGTFDGYREALRLLQER